MPPTFEEMADAGLARLAGLPAEDPWIRPENRNLLIRNLPFCCLQDTTRGDYFERKIRPALPFLSTDELLLLAGALFVSLCEPEARAVRQHIGDRSKEQIQLHRPGKPEPF